MNATETFLGTLSVVELGSRVAVGAAGSLLAQLGASVMVVEPAVPSSVVPWAERTWPESAALTSLSALTGATVLSRSP